MKTYETSYPIKNITVELSHDLQDIDIRRLGDALLEGLTAKNYLKLYRQMKSEIEKDFEDRVIMLD